MPWSSVGSAVDGDVATTLVDLDYIEVLENTEETLVDVFRALEPVASIDRPLLTPLVTEALIELPQVSISTGLPSSSGSRKTATRFAALTFQQGLSRQCRRRRDGACCSTMDGLPSGRLRIVYRISQGVLDSKVVGVPGGLKNELSGRFVIESDHASGELATDGANVWGFGPKC